MADLHLNQPAPGLASYFDRKAMEELRVLCNRMGRTYPGGQVSTDRINDKTRTLVTTSVLEALSKSLVYSHIEVGTKADKLMKVPGWVIVELPQNNADDRKLINRIYDEIEKDDDPAAFVSNMTEGNPFPIPTREEATRAWGLRLHIPVHWVDSIVETYGPAPSE